jgi:hypothetical protein
MRAMLLTCLLAATPIAAQTADIRGLTFDIELGIRIDGVLSGLGTAVHLQNDAIPMVAEPHTFDVLPDPAAPFDPAHIVIRMRLPTAEEADDPMRFELVGTYDAATGAIDAEGTLAGCHSWLTPFTSDDFGQIDALANIAIMIRQPELTLHAVVAPSVQDSQIIGTDIAAGLALGPRAGLAGEVDGIVSKIAWLPLGEVDPANALDTEFLQAATIELTSLQAHSLDVFGDLTGDLQLTQSDVIKLHKLFGPVTWKNFKADVTADGVVDAADADYEQFLVRTIGHQDGPGAATGAKGSAATTGEKSQGTFEGKPLGGLGKLP